MNSKVNAYIGFALKSRQLVLGVNAIQATRTRKYLLLLCHTAAKNTVKEAILLAKKHNIKIVEIKNKTLEDIVNKENCKLGAILNQELSQAILKNLDDDYCLFQGGGCIEQ